ncbi:MAG: hypothetical protein HC838_14250 [Spirulinaceae cyanobacterium RM2_2_10]|nr:hypothetical protein [Spirulinaceae cyanobacterium SM2_1_0]NJO20962.1 hypothetical protein [Spirulinaceae cyanobacterium RM2_2_10]
MLLAKLLTYHHSIEFQIMKKVIAFLMSAADSLFADLIEHESRFIAGTVDATWIKHRKTSTAARQPQLTAPTAKTSWSELPMG